MGDLITGVFGKPVDKIKGLNKDLILDINLKIPVKFIIKYLYESDYEFDERFEETVLSALSKTWKHVIESHDPKDSVCPCGSNSIEVRNNIVLCKECGKDLIEEYTDE